MIESFMVAILCKVEKRCSVNIRPNCVTDNCGTNERLHLRGSKPQSQSIQHRRYGVQVTARREETAARDQNELRSVGFRTAIRKRFENILKAVTCFQRMTNAKARQVNSRNDEIEKKRSLTVLVPNRISNHIKETGLSLHSVNGDTNALGDR